MRVPSETVDTSGEVAQQRPQKCQGDSAYDRRKTAEIPMIPHRLTSIHYHFKQNIYKVNITVEFDMDKCICVESDFVYDDNKM
jgi:hypothetical protein